MKRFKIVILSLFLLGSILNASKFEPYNLPINLFINIDNGKGLLDIGLYVELAPNNNQKKDKVTDKIKEKIILLIEKKSVDELVTQQGKKELKQELIDTISKNLSYSRIKNLYFSKFTIQSVKLSTKKEVIVKEAYPKFVEELYEKSLAHYASWKKTKKPYMYHKALFYIDSAITIEPNRSDLWFLKGMILSETKTQLQYEFALTSFLQAIIIRPKNDPAQMMVAQTLFNLGRYEEAIVRYKWIFKTYKKEAMDYVTLYPFAVSHMALNKKQELLTYIDETLEEYDKNNTDIWIIWAVIHKNYGDKKHAIEILKWLIEMSEDNKKRSYLEFLLAKYEKGDKK